MSILSVSQERCVKCGICAEVCPAGIIRMGKQGPRIILDKACLKCGHCTAVCPHDALDNINAPVANQASIEGISPIAAATAAQFLRSRRSTRCFKDTAVPRNKLVRLLEIARFAPSGSNAQGISYIIVEGRDTINKIIAVTVDWLDEQIEKGLEWTKPYAGVTKIYRKTGRDVILRDAPHLVIATSSVDNSFGRDNSVLSLAYAELYAPTLGLGTCWSGFVEMCALAGYLPLIEVLQIPASTKVTGAIMVGYPKYKFRRLVDRNPLQTTWL